MFTLHYQRRAVPKGELSSLPGLGFCRCHRRRSSDNEPDDGHWPPVFALHSVSGRCQGPGSVSLALVLILSPICRFLRYSGGPPTWDDGLQHLARLVSKLEGVPRVPLWPPRSWGLPQALPCGAWSWAIFDNSDYQEAGSRRDWPEPASRPVTSRRPQLPTDTAETLNGADWPVRRALRRSRLVTRSCPRRQRASHELDELHVTVGRPWCP